MRNWADAWAVASAGDGPLKGKVGVAALPAGEDGRPAATLGGQQLAVSRYSEHPEEAADLVRYLTSYDEQKRRALEGSFNPTRRSLYRSEEHTSELQSLMRLPYSVFCLNKKTGANQLK